jgi:hypothetical protein
LGAGSKPAPCPKKCEWIGSPPRHSAVVPSGRLPPKLRAKKSWQYVGRPIMHAGQVPHELKLIPTRSPTTTFATFGHHRTGGWSASVRR